MNFGALTGGLLKVTEGLKGFDEMAAEDDYVNSDSLNVKRPDDHEESQPLTSSNDSNHYHSEDEESGGHYPLHHQTKGSSSNTPSRPTVQRSQPSEGVIDAMAQHVLEIEMSESSDAWETSSTAAVKTQRSKSSARKHRFLEDLDQRMAKDNTNNINNSLAGSSISILPTRSVHASLSSSSSTTTASSKKSWSVWGMVSKNNNNQDAQPDPENQDNGDGGESSTLPPLSRQRLNPKASSNSRNENLANVAKVSSTGMLDADDLLALEQMKQLSESQQETNWAELVQQHPRESFIAFTLVITMVVYFYVRQFSKEDDID